jgi:hypothetical protein
MRQSRCEHAVNQTAASLENSKRVACAYIPRANCRLDVNGVLRESYKFNQDRTVRGKDQKLDRSSVTIPPKVTFDGADVWTSELQSRNAA